MVNRAIGCEDTDLKGRFAQYLSLADSAMVYVVENGETIYRSRLGYAISYTLPAFFGESIPCM